MNKIKKIRLGKWDKIWSKIARDLTPCCEYCGSSNSLNAHHFKGRSCKATRFMMLNAVILCASHHTFNHEFSAHRTPEKFERWFKKNFGKRHRDIVLKAQTQMTERQAIKDFEVEVENYKRNGYWKD